MYQLGQLERYEPFQLHQLNYWIRLYLLRRQLERGVIVGLAHECTVERE